MNQVESPTAKQTTPPLPPPVPHAIPPLKDWQIYAGGISSAPGKNSFKFCSEKGEYYIDPICFPKSNKHRGYMVKFADTKGILAAGLWSWISLTGIAFNIPQPCLCLNDGIKAVRIHFDSIVPKQVNPVEPLQVNPA
jgi:hypothetical protein